MGWRIDWCGYIERLNATGPRKSKARKLCCPAALCRNGGASLAQVGAGFVDSSPQACPASLRHHQHRDVGLVSFLIGFPTVCASAAVGGDDECSTKRGSPNTFKRSNGISSI